MSVNNTDNIALPDVIVSSDSIRDKNLDRIKGLGIIAVIIGHIIPIGNDFIFSFHMPLFFIVGGYLYNPKPIIKACRKDIKRLLLPYLVTAFIIFGYWIIRDFRHNDINIWNRILTVLWANGSPNHSSYLFSDIPVIGAIWFLFGLFWCRNIFNILHHRIKKLWMLIFVCLSLTIIAIYIDTKWANLPLAILPGISALTFYAMGYLIKKYDGFKNIHWILLLSFVIVWILSFLCSRMSMVRCYYENPIINFLGAIGAVMLLYKMSNYVGLNGMLEWLGKFSLAILCFHLLDLMISLHSNFGMNHYALVFLFNFIFCVAGVIVGKRIPIFNKIYGLK